MEEIRGQRVVLCAPGFPTSRDDADKPFLLDHAAALAEAGLQVTVVSPAVSGAPSRQTIDGVKVHRVRYAPRRLETLAATGSMYREARGPKGILAVPMMLALAIGVWREARRESAILYGHWWIPGGLVIAVVGALMRCPRVVHVHGSDAAMTTNTVFKIVARWVLRVAVIRLAVSDELAKWGEELTGRNFNVLPMPLNLDRLPDPSPVPDQGFVLAVGRLVPEKGFDLLVEAVGLIEAASRPSVTIVGIGPERGNLELQARHRGVDLHLPGAVAPSEMGDWYRRSCVVVVPSRREGFGLVAAEAAAAGRAVVATKVGALPQIIENGVSGVLVEPENSKALMDALQVVEPEWGRQGPAQVLELSPEIHAQQILRLFQDLSK